MTLREIRRALKAYFGAEKHSICFVRAKGRTVIDIEYEDFRPEQVVESEVRHIVGSGYLINVKRECSPRLIEQIHSFIASDADGRQTLFFLIRNYIP